VEGPVEHRRGQRGDRLRLEAGHFLLPSGAGLGIELDEAAIERRSPRPRGTHDIRYPDGAVGDV